MSSETVTKTISNSPDLVLLASQSESRSAGFQVILEEVSSNQLEELVSPSGQLVGVLSVPPNLSNQANSTLIVTLSNLGTGNSSNSRPLYSDSLNITLLDSQGNSITQLDSPLTICLSLGNNTKKGNVCLGYYDEASGKWRCEDRCLNTITRKSNDSSQDSRLLCGQTSHLTNFALLLSGANDPCQPAKDNKLAWASLGLVAGAVLIVALAVVAIELRIRWKTVTENRELKSISRATL